MKILALEFSSPQRSVALIEDHGLSVGEIIETAPGQAMKPLGMVEAALKQAGLEREQIDCLAIGLGPGSYTGIRVAIALAQGWQLARDVKLLGLSSAECVAAQAQADGFTGRVCVVIDAQRNEHYVASYELGSGEYREISPLRLAASADVHEREHAGETLIGPEVTRSFRSGRVIFPRAATLGRLGLAHGVFMAGARIEPIYLRETAFVKAVPPRILPPVKAV
jgi:tRNA threonylcarbamoyl adenosine modification protein YeaZ